MKIEAFRDLVREIGYGKKVVDAVYVLATEDKPFTSELSAEVRRAELAAQPREDWNLLKFHLKEYGITFLSYPDFDSDPHPALKHATKINLNSGRVVRTDYSKRANPPILHRKETFLPPADLRIETFSALTKQEEEAGLYRDPSRIGLRLYWTSILKKKGLGFEGHQLISQDTPADIEPIAEDVIVDRHRTAINRYDLSKPVKLLLKHGLLSERKSFFDYGCGRGMDAEGLLSLGYDALGWDPAFQPDARKSAAEVVNIGYVLNVIEHPSEREDALRGAFDLAKEVLIVSVLTRGQETEAHTRALGDGYLTKSGTFQKFYAPGELEELIEQVLEREAVTLALGICLVFPSADMREQFLSTRMRRHIDWTDISNQLRFTQSVSREEALVGRYELNKEVLDPLWARMLELGRVPSPEEYTDVGALRESCGGLKRAADLLIHYHGLELLHEARHLREEDVLVYLAMKNFERRFLRKHVPDRVKRDIKAFFGDFDRAKQKSFELLFASGDPDEVRLAVEKLDFGLYDRDEEHFSFHSSLLNQLPAILRVYVFCGLRRFGDIEEVDLVKIHICSRKLTLQSYDDFDGKPLPELRVRVKTDLLKDFVTVFDHTLGEDQQLLYFKERFVGSDYSFENDALGFSKRLRSFGFAEETIGYGPSLNQFDAFREERGLTASLLKKRKT